jgi:hypothetical protein
MRLGSVTLALPPAVARAAVFVAFAGTVSLRGIFLSARLARNDPLRIMKDNDGVWQWMETRDALAERARVCRECVFLPRVTSTL